MTEYVMMPAHGLSILIVVGTMLITPFYVYATYVESGASRRAGLWLAIVTAIFGAVATLVCLANVANKLGPLGNLIIPLCWATPSVLLYLNRRTLVATSLSQKWLVGLQVFRVIGGVFLIEMAIGNQPGIFAYPAGIGDIAVGLFATYTLIKHRNDAVIPDRKVLTLIVIGMTDFFVAFFFGFTSSDTPLQLFHPETANRIDHFPTGMIPFFLVPYAIFFHLLSYLSLKASRQNADTPAIG